MSANTIEGEKQVTQALTAALNAATQDALQKLAGELRGEIQEQFLSEGARGGTPWPARKRLGNGHPLLVLTGRLLRSLVDANSPDHVEERVSESELIFGTRLRYAEYLNAGTRKMPARPIITPAMLAGKEVTWK